MYKHLIFLNNLVIDYDLNQVLQVQSNISERNIILKNKENKDFPTNDGSIRSIKLWSRKSDLSLGHGWGWAESPPQSLIKSFILLNII